MSVDTDGERPAWPIQYLEDHTLHIGIVALFIAYPFAYDFLTSTFGLPARMVLPQIRTMLTILWLGLFAMSFDFISGYTGYLSFGHAAFFGIGAYFVVLGYNGQIPVLPAELPFMALMLIGALLAALFAFVVGLVSFRLTGVYFAMITLGVAELLFVMGSHWDFLTPGEGDPSDGVAAGSPPDIALFEPVIGVPFVDPLNAQIGAFGDTALLGIDFGNPQIVSYFMIGAVVLLCYLSMQRIIHSPFGRVMIAIRENEQRAKAIGYSTFRYKIGAFMISAFFGGIAGALLVSYVGTVDPETTLFFLVTGFALVATIIGGIGTLSGAFFGYLFLESLEEFLARSGNGGGLQPFLEQTLPGGVLSFEIGGLPIREGLDAFMTGHGDFYAGIIFVVFVLYVPMGLLGTLRARIGTKSLAKSAASRLFGADTAEPTEDGE
jgi:branched-chain amino acid transport system permease protein